MAQEILNRSNVVGEFLGKRKGLSDKPCAALAQRAINEGLRREVDLFALCFSSEDKDEGVKAFLEKRKPNFKGR